MSDDEFRGEGHHRTVVGFSAGNYSLDFTSLLERQPRTDEEREAPDAKRGCWIRLAGDTLEFQEQTPEGRGSRVLIVVEPSLKHVDELVAAAEVIAGQITLDPAEHPTLRQYVPVRLDLPRLVENAKWELERG